MKIIWVSLLLAGLCLAKEEEAADDLQAIEGRRLEMRSGDTPCHGCASGADTTSSHVVVPSIDLHNLLNDKNELLSSATSAIKPDLAPEDLLLKIGDIISYLGSATGDKDPYGLGGHGDPLTIDEHGLIGTLSTLLGVAGGVDGGGGKLGMFVTMANTLKTTILDLGARGLEIANFILAIIGLALIAGYLAGTGGELGVLDVGFSSSGSSSAYRSLSESPAVDRISNMVYDAISNFNY